MPLPFPGKPPSGYEPTPRPKQNRRLAPATGQPQLHLQALSDLTVSSPSGVPISTLNVPCWYLISYHTTLRLSRSKFALFEFFNLLVFVAPAAFAFGGGTTSVYSTTNRSLCQIRPRRFRSTSSARSAGRQPSVTQQEPNLPQSLVVVKFRSPPFRTHPTLATFWMRSPASFDRRAMARPWRNKSRIYHNCLSLSNSAPHLVQPTLSRFALFRCSSPRRRLQAGACSWRNGGRIYHNSLELSNSAPPSAIGLSDLIPFRCPSPPRCRHRSPMIVCSRRNEGRIYHKRPAVSNSRHVLFKIAHIARRPSSARARVTSSVYSRSPPTGRPRASRVTVTSLKASC